MRRPAGSCAFRASAPRRTQACRPIPGVKRDWPRRLFHRHRTTEMRWGCEKCAIQKLVRPGRRLIDQRRPRGDESGWSLDLSNRSPSIQPPSLGQLLLVLQEQSQGAVGLAGAEVGDGHGGDVVVRQEGSDIKAGVQAQGEVAGKERTGAIGYFGPDPSPSSLCRLSSTAPLGARSHRDLRNETSHSKCATAGATGDLTLISHVDEIAQIVVPGSPIVEDGGTPGYRLNVTVAGERGRDGPVPPDQGGEKMVALFRRSY